MTDIVQNFPTSTFSSPSPIPPHFVCPQVPTKPEAGAPAPSVPKAAAPPPPPPVAAAPRPAPPPPPRAASPPPPPPKAVAAVAPAPVQSRSMESDDDVVRCVMCGGARFLPLLGGEAPIQPGKPLRHRSCGSCVCSGWGGLLADVPLRTSPTPKASKCSFPPLPPPPSTPPACSQTRDGGEARRCHRGCEGQGRRCLRFGGSRGRPQGPAFPPRRPLAATPSQDPSGSSGCAAAGC